MTETPLITPNGEYTVDISNGDVNLHMYPTGTRVVPPRPAQHWVWNGTAWVEGMRVVASSDVNKERDRRLAEDLECNGSLFDFDPVSKTRISGAGTLALGAIVDGAQPGDRRWHISDYDFVWIDANTHPDPMDAHQVYAFGQAAAAKEARMILRATALKAMHPIPLDYKDDSYWV